MDIEQDAYLALPLAFSFAFARGWCPALFVHCKDDDVDTHTHTHTRMYACS